MINPAHMVPVTDCSPEILRDILEHLDLSTSFEHLVYREAELDAVWSIVGFRQNGDPALARLRDIVHQAHDLVGQQRPREAADLLRALLDGS